MKQLIPMETNLPVVFAHKDTPYTSSLALAKGGRVEHRAIISLINTHLGDLQDFGRVTFEMRPLPTKGGVQNVKTCRLNKEQATFLITLMRNTRPVVAFKKELVKQFYEMEQFIATVVSTRHDYPLLTEAVKMAHDEPKPYHFANEADMLNRLITGYSAKEFRAKHGVAKGESIRPHLTPEQIALMEILQKVDTGLLIAVPDYQQRKRYLEWYIGKLQGKHLTA